MKTEEFYDCVLCGDEVPKQRWVLGYHVCMWCGEDNARAERASWCVVQEYGKGNYQFVTAASAAKTLKQTNQKELRT
jgi:hypothetical protein